MTRKNEANAQEWPRTIDHADQISVSAAVAQVAIGLCRLRTAAAATRHQIEEQKFARALKTAVLPSEQGQLVEKWEAQHAVYERLLRPAGYLDEAIDLIDQARCRVSRELRMDEFILRNGTSEEAIEAAIGHELERSRVPFEKLCRPDLKHDIEEIITVSNVVSKADPFAPPRSIDVKWNVYRGDAARRSFEGLFWSWWNNRGTEEAGKLLLAEWTERGLPPNDFLSLDRCRRNKLASRTANLPNIATKKRRKTKRRRSG